uniref:DNA/RNA-binding protein Kin17 WH-like domain-containing protein n=1 Tax=Ananas comosus var. bracteatus TaxID=296719 RepID=A0A6V7NKB9_ANACO|nr:unnamed protein product [Ananas comosus var. bracteatus]
MGKNEFLTPKAIANRIKAKGLQKLRWYCQMCQKQCRDENGFKCHCMSEGHQRQMQVFGQNPDRIVGGFSEEFERAFLDSCAAPTASPASPPPSSTTMQGRGHPKGWFITYVDRDSETLFKDRLKAKRHKADLADEERQERAIAHQIERAAAVSVAVAETPLASDPNNPTASHTDGAGSGITGNPPGGKVAFLLQSQSASVSSKPSNEAAASKSPPN